MDLKAPNLGTPPQRQVVGSQYLKIRDPPQNPHILRSQDPKFRDTPHSQPQVVGSQYLKLGTPPEAPHSEVPEPQI